MSFNNIVNEWRLTMWEENFRLRVIDKCRCVIETQESFLYFMYETCYEFWKMNGKMWKVEKTGRIEEVEMSTAPKEKLSHVHPFFEKVNDDKRVQVSFTLLYTQNELV